VKKNYLRAMGVLFFQIPHAGRHGGANKLCTLFFQIAHASEQTSLNKILALGPKERTCVPICKTL